jgi:hypothetical protein
MTDNNPNRPPEVDGEGLRYVNKPSGSAFGGLTNKTRSCFRCGQHRSRDQMSTIRVLGRSEPVCSPDCRSPGGG